MSVTPNFRRVTDTAHRKELFPAAKIQTLISYRV